MKAQMRSLGLLLLCFVSLSAATMEVKRPLNRDQELKVRDDARSVVVSGDTFSYTFDKRHGLISSVVVLGREISGAPIPDLVLAEHLDPTFSPYSAKRESEARVRVASATPERVLIEADGAYTGENGVRFPLDYHLGYDISIDGVVLVSVANTALEDCSFRWLTLSAGSVKAEFAKFLNWMPEQASSQSTSYKFQPVPTEAGKVLGGVWLPWVWIGDQSRGLEVTTWDVSSQTYNQVDGSRRQDESEMFGVHRNAEQVRWENFLVRRTFVHAHKGWKRGGEFVLAVTPSKSFDPYYAMLKGAHLGPHQHLPHITLPDENQIRTLAQNGHDLVVGMANWRSGEYTPLNDADLRRVIELCHKYGMKIIPYVTLVDLAHSTQTFRDHGEDWAIEPTTEFCKTCYSGFRDPAKELAYRNNPEEQTTLMCPGAPGWREHWKKTIDNVVTNYDFDGLYIDFWFGRMVCENTRHGCGGRFRRHTVLGSRDMLTYAYNRLKSKNPKAIIKANTNTLATALITSLVDIRLVGESTDITGMDPDSRQWLYSSYRLGEPTEFLWAESRWNQDQKAAFAALINFLPEYYDRPRFEPRRGFDDFDVYRFLQADKGEWKLGISGDGFLDVKPSEVVANTVELPDGVLATLVNTKTSPVTAEVPVRQQWLAYDPLAEQILDPANGVLHLDMGSGAYRHLVLSEAPQYPHLLFALGARKRDSETWDETTRKLRISVDAVEGTHIRFAVLSKLPVKSVSTSGGKPIPIEQATSGRLARFEAVHEPGGSIELQF